MTRTCHEEAARKSRKNGFECKISIFPRGFMQPLILCFVQKGGKKRSSPGAEGARGGGGGGGGGGCDLQGRPEHTDAVDHSGTWHVQLSGFKTWHIRPVESAPEFEGCPPDCGDDELEGVKEGGGGYVVECEAGDLLLINTRAWWHRTTLPVQEGNSVSYARDFYIGGRKGAANDGADGETIVFHMVSCLGAQSCRSLLQHAPDARPAYKPQLMLLHLPSPSPPPPPNLLPSSQAERQTTSAWTQGYTPRGHFQRARSYSTPSPCPTRISYPSAEIRAVCWIRGGGSLHCGIWPRETLSASRGTRKENSKSTSWTRRRARWCGSDPWEPAICFCV